MPSTDHLRRQMVRRQIQARGILQPNILHAFRTVPREQFVPEDLADCAYEDRPLPIGEDQTISQPFIVASMIEAAGLKDRHKVLEVGAGSGFAAAIISRIVEKVFSIERHQALARRARGCIEALKYENCHIIAGDGAQGLPSEAPFDAILVAACSTDVPAQLMQQLRVNGRLIIPLGKGAVQHLTCIIRTGENTWESHEMSLVRFVPLLSGFVPAR